MNRLWLIGITLILLSGCAYRSEIIFDEAGNKATLKSNTKSNAEINLKEKKAKIEQLDQPWWQKILPKTLEIDK